MREGIGFLDGDNQALVGIGATDVLLDLKGIKDTARLSLRVSEESMYSENIWRFSKENPNLDYSQVTVNFSRFRFDDGSIITDPGHELFLRTVKDYAFSMLNHPPPSHPKWSTFCTTLHRGLAALLRFMNSNAIHRLSDLTRLDLNQFLAEMVEQQNASGGTITNRVLRSRVYGLQWLHDQRDKMENGLILDPFADYGSLTQWAAKCCVENIPRDARRVVEMPDKVARELLVHALDDLQIADTLVQIRELQSKFKPKKRQESGRTMIVNPIPWHRFNLKSGSQIRSLEQRLLAACYIVIAMLTGMRWHEITAIKSDPSLNWSEELIEYDGAARVFYFVSSATNKLQAVPTKYKWQTLPLVKNALTAAERGLASRRKSGSFLFPSQEVGRRASDSGMLNALQCFAAYHNVRHGDEIYKVATHQFRRKYARLMVRHGLGIKALQDQLKHFDVEMTKSYGDMNLYVELQAEKFVLSEEQYLEIVSGQVPVVGGGASDVQILRKQFLGMTLLDRGKFIAELPKTALIEQMDDGLCMFRPKQALCGGDRAACRSADCNNAVIYATGKRKTFEWRVMENEKMLDYFKGQPLKVSFLTERLRQLRKLLAQIDMVEINSES